jgi:hypothetical protein
MKCNTCQHEWIYNPDYLCPCGKWICLKFSINLHDAEPEDIEKCEYYEYYEIRKEK